MILGAICMLVANAATLLGAQALLDRIRSGQPAADAVLFLILRFLIISATVLAAGLLKLFTPLALGLAGAAAIAALLATGTRPRLPRWSSDALGVGWKILGAAVLLRLLLQVWFFAPHLGDSLAYPLPKIAEWVRAGGFTGELGVDVRSTFPAGFELIEAWWVVFLHHDVLIEMGGVEFFLLSLVAVSAIAEALGWGSRTAAVAAALFSLNPANYFHATSCVNDGAVTALILSTAALIAAGVNPLILLIPAALGAGIKPTFVYAVPGLALLGALLPRGESAETAGRPRAAWGAAVVAGFVGAFWYARNYLVYGNPIHPMVAGGMKSALTGSVMQRFGPSPQSLAQNLSVFLDIRIYDVVYPPDAFCTGGYGWGPVGFALGSLALVPLLRSDRLLRRLAVGFAVSTLCVLTLVELDPYNSRFMVFLAALPTLALARLWDRHRFIPILGSLALLLQFGETFVPGNMPPGGMQNLLKSGWRDRAAVPSPPEAAGRRVAFACDDFGLSYPLYLPSYERGIVYLRERTTDELLETLDREKVDLIYHLVAIPRHLEVFEGAVRRGRLVPVSHGMWKGYAVLPR